MSSTFERHESRVRLYGRLFPSTFVSACGSILKTDSGSEYIDFFSGAGALNYGHSNKFIQNRLVEYLSRDGIIHALDMQTNAKADFLERLNTLILQPRNLNYKVQFCGPTGADAIEASLKLARKVTGRMGVVAFSGSYHGLSLGSLAVTSINTKRAAAGVPLGNVTFFPFPNGSLSGFDTRAYAESVLADPLSGVAKPAAIIVETVQAEGGVNVAPVEWLQWLRQLCDRYGILLICDEIQVGCGRTGWFFSFERAGIVPDIVAVSKSISGYGAPMAILLIRPNMDIWNPGEHTGTFRGYQLAYVGASAALDYIHAHNLQSHVRSCATLVDDFIRFNIAPLHPGLTWRGLGLIWGIDFSACETKHLAGQVAKRCYERGLLIEYAGRDDSVLKLLPPLTIECDLLQSGLRIIRDCVAHQLRTVEAGEPLTINERLV